MSVAVSLYLIIYIRAGRRLVAVALRCQLVGVSVASEGVGVLLMLSDWLRILSGVLLLMSGGWLLSWLLFVVSVGCQLVGGVGCSCSPIAGRVSRC